MSGYVMNLNANFLTTMNDIQKNPYRLFFLLGVIGLVAGLAVWVLFAFYSPEYYLGKMHAHYMIGIFLLSFVIGFLMTAIPRMTASSAPAHQEILWQLVPMLGAVAFGLFESQEVLFFISLAIALLVLFLFCFRRIITCRHMIPDVFPLVIVSLLSGLMGALFFIFNEPYIGGRLFYLNLVLGLCVGIGAKLIPMILRLGCSGKHGTAEMWAVGGLLTLSCFLEAFWIESYGGLLRFSVVLLVFFRHWKAHMFSGFNSSLAIGVRISALSIVLGTMGLWLFPDYRLESLHLLYISGFGLLTLMVASRVILSHGSYDLSLEFKNWFLKIPIGLIVLAALTRVSAVFIEGGYDRHLAYAALTFLMAAILWSIYFVPKLLFRRV